PASLHDRACLITDPKALYYGITVNDQSLTPGDHPRLGPTRFKDWLSTTPNHAQQTEGACSAFRVREIRFRPAAHGSGDHTPAAQTSTTPSLLPSSAG